MDVTQELTLGYCECNHDGKTFDADEVHAIANAHDDVMEMIADFLYFAKSSGIGHGGLEAAAKRYFAAKEGRDGHDT